MRMVVAGLDYNPCFFLHIVPDVEEECFQLMWFQLCISHHDGVLFMTSVNQSGEVHIEALHPLQPAVDDLDAMQKKARRVDGEVRHCTCTFHLHCQHSIGEWRKKRDFQLPVFGLYWGRRRGVSRQRGVLVRSEVRVGWVLSM